MSNLVLLQQQWAPSSAPPPPPTEDPWQFWDAAAIARATQCPQENVESDWPAIFAELSARGIATQSVCGGVIGTVAIETASTFKPVREAFWEDEDYRRTRLRYYPWYGRGYVQLTWEGNYAEYGPLCNVDLTGDPDGAMNPDTAAKVIAEYFVQRQVANAAENNNWPEVRRLVQGGHDGLPRLVTIVQALGLPG